MKSSLLSAARKEVILCDGAMGTELFARGLGPNQCGMLWNRDRAGDVRQTHAAYVAAGCRLITTNSFGGTRTMLGQHGLAMSVRDLNKLAAAIAREAVGETGWVLGDVGPFGDFLEPLGDTTAEELQAIFSEQIEALAEGGADAILVETMSDPAEAAVGVRAAKAVTSLPVAATLAFQKTAGTFRTMMGAPAADALGTVLEAGAEIVGANCGTDLALEDYIELASELARAAGPALAILQPNAGAPQSTPEGTRYNATPEEMAAIVPRLREAGIAIIGGCCGTTPRHLAAMAHALR